MGLEGRHAFQSVVQEHRYTMVVLMIKLKGQALSVNKGGNAQIPDEINSRQDSNSFDTLHQHPHGYESQILILLSSDPDTIFGLSGVDIAPSSFLCSSVLDILLY